MKNKIPKTKNEIHYSRIEPPSLGIFFQKYGHIVRASPFFIREFQSMIHFYCGRARSI